MECRNATPFAFRKCHCFLLPFSNVGSEAALLSFFNLFETTWRSWRHCVTSCKRFVLLRTQLGQKEMKHDETSTIKISKMMLMTLMNYVPWCALMCLGIRSCSPKTLRHQAREEKSVMARREFQGWMASHFTGIVVHMLCTCLSKDFQVTSTLSTHLGTLICRSLQCTSPDSQNST